MVDQTNFFLALEHYSEEGIHFLQDETFQEVFYHFSHAYTVKTYNPLMHEEQIKK